MPITNLILLPALPEILLAGLLSIILVASMFLAAEKRFGFALNAVLLSFIITLLAIFYGSQEEVLALGDLFVSDSFAILFKIMVLLAAFVALLMGKEFVKHAGFDQFEFSILVGFAVLGMMMMLSAHDLMALYIGLELQSLSLYVLASIRRNSLRATEAGLKYFILGALASGLLLYGASLIYGFVGSTDFSAIATVIAKMQSEQHVYNGTNQGVIIGLVFIISAMAFKISATPFHMWTPDVYEGVPTPVTAFFAAAPKVAGIGLLLRLVMEPFGGLAHEWQQIIIVLSALSMALGAFAGLVQKNIKRLMAYSSIGHVGFILMGMAAGSNEGVSAITVYLAIYLFTTLGAFAVILSMRRQNIAVEAIEDLKGFGKTHPFYAVALMLFMFSMAGIPPLAGFFAKWYIFSAAIQAGLIYLAVIGALASVVSAYYYLRIIKIMYFDDSEMVALDIFPAPILKLMVSIAVILVVGFVFYPNFITTPANISAQGLF